MSTRAINGERPPSARILLSSDAFDERGRFDAWREELMLRVMRIDVDVPDKKSFHTRLRVLNLPNVGVIERRSTPSVLRRTAELIRDGDDSLVFSLPWRKSIETRGLAVEARVGAGEAIIHSLNEITCSRAPQGFRGVSLRIARQTALSVAPHAERRLNRTIAIDRSASFILQSYLVSLVSTADGLSAASQFHAVSLKL
jgi:AraC-binding-like domain